MCSRCKKIHQKVKSSDQHKIIDIKDIAEFQQHSSGPDFNTLNVGFTLDRYIAYFVKPVRKLYVHHV